MPLTGVESDLLANLKFYLVQANDELSTAGIRSLSRLKPLERILFLIVEESPESISDLVNELHKTLEPYRERHTQECQEKQGKAREKKRALEIGDGNGKNLPQAKKQRIEDVLIAIASTGDNYIADITAEENGGNDSCDHDPQEATSHHQAPLDPMSTTSELSTAGFSAGSADSSMPQTGLEQVAQPSPKVPTNSITNQPNSSLQVESTATRAIQQMPNTIQISDATPRPFSEGRVLRTGPSPSCGSHDSIHKDCSVQGSVTIQASTPDLALSNDKLTTTTHASSSRNGSCSSILPPNPSPAGVISKIAGPHLMNEDAEIAIRKRDKDILLELKDHFKEQILPKYKNIVHLEKVNDRISEVFDLCPRLNFARLRSDLLSFAETHVSNLDANAEPMAIFNAIAVSVGDASDARLVRIYGQINLWKSIERKIKENHGAVQDTKIEKRNQLHKEHKAGKQWIQLIHDFGGSGVIFVFVFAELGGHKFAHGYNDFQRDCLTHILHQLPSIKTLANQIGNSALGDFCRHGQLSFEVIERVKSCCGPRMVFVESEDDVSESEDDGIEAEKASVVCNHTSDSNMWMSDDESD
ncbi:MAG: hypothetical protein Q9186_007496 [Xanthomendoza sp. 1 TL-2023]